MWEAGAQLADTLRKWCEDLKAAGRISPWGPQVAQAGQTAVGGGHDRAVREKLRWAKERRKRLYLI